MSFALVSNTPFSNTTPQRARRWPRSAFEESPVREIASDTTSRRTRHLLREVFKALPPRAQETSSASPLVQEIEQSLSLFVPWHQLVKYGAAYRHFLDEIASPVSKVVSETASGVVSDVITVAPLDRALAQQLQALLALAQEERFEDGMDSNLSAGLRVLFRTYSADFAAILEEELKKREVNGRILAEILQTLGDIEDDATSDQRFTILVDFLKSPSPLVRDSAAVGLSYLDDERAAPYLLDAIKREPSEAFRKDLEKIVEQLGA